MNNIFVNSFTIVWRSLRINQEAMRELLHLFNTSLGERGGFMRKVVPLSIGDLRVSRALDRAAHVKHWKQEHEKLDAALADLSHASVGEADRAELLLLKDFSTACPICWPGWLTC